MKYTVVHSKDPYMLARLATDLQMSLNRIMCEVDGLTDTPFLDGKEWLCLYSNRRIGFYTHDCRDEDERRFSITEDNYIKVLTQILEP